MFQVLTPQSTFFFISIFEDENFMINKNHDDFEMVCTNLIWFIFDFITHTCFLTHIVPYLEIKIGSIVFLKIIII